MYNLVFISTMAFLGTYRDLPSCQNAIRAIFEKELNPYNMVIPNFEKIIALELKYQKDYTCIPVKKG